MYEDFFGLEDEPFRLTPDPRYLFLSSKHAEALAHLRLGLTESSGFVCITGEVGSGKTTLLHSFLADIGAGVLVACVYLPPLSRVDLLRRICREFGIPVSGESASELVEALHDFLKARHAEGRTCVLVIDEAQTLAADLLEQIRLLLNLETSTEKLLRIILVGQPQLRRVLLDPDLAQLNQRITLRWHLGPLSRRETVEYVAHRLTVASGGRATRIFTGPALRMLYSVSQGVPRVLNMVTHRALLAAFIDRSPTVRRVFVARAYRELQSVPLPGTLTLARKAAWGVAGLGLGAALFFYGAALLDRFGGANAPRAVDAEVQDAAANAKSVAPAEVAPAVARESAEEARRPVADVQVAPPMSEDDLLRRLAANDPSASERSALQAVFAAWREAPPGGADSTDADAMAGRRGLQSMAFTGNRSMLRLLDLPAVVTLRGPHSGAARQAALTAIDSSGVRLSLGGDSLVLDADLFDRYWTGEARLFWRDYEHLGPMLHRGTRGVEVVRLQTLLHQMGAFDGTPSGQYESDTEAAVRRFQSAHLLPPDGVVGPLTQIVLYGAAKRERPSLAASLVASARDRS